MSLQSAVPAGPKDALGMQARYQIEAESDLILIWELQYAQIPGLEGA